MSAESGARWMRVVERLLFLVAAVAFVWYAAARTEASREQAALSAELERASAALQEASTEAVAPPDVDGAGIDEKVPVRIARRAAARRAPEHVVARIEMPRLRLSAYAREGVDLSTLRGSVGHVPGTALPGEAGNAAFAAHRDTFFRPLKNVREGDAITVTTPRGTFRYTVSGTQIVDPSDVWVLQPTADATLTFVTCYPFDYIGSAPQRFIVRARLVEPE
jgi:LPXTG-site transpeptidase (sortase) family protein